MAAVGADFGPVTNGPAFSPQAKHDLPLLRGADLEGKPRAVVDRLVLRLNEEDEFPVSSLVALIQPRAREVGVECHFVRVERPCATGGDGDLDCGARRLRLERGTSDYRTNERD